jgi:hypothetical protein
VELYIPSPSTPPWHGAQLKESTGTTLPLPFYYVGWDSGLSWDIYPECFWRKEGKRETTRSFSLEVMFATCMDLAVSLLKEVSR